jgi:translocation and assembly module TamB
MRRGWRIGIWTLGSALLVIVLLVAAVLVAGNTPGGRVLIEREAARLSGGRLRLSGLAGSFPSTIDLGRLQLSDARGVWLTAEHVSLRWSPLALLARHVKVRRLQIVRLDIERRPVSEAAQQGSTRLPRIDIGQLSIHALELGPQLASVHPTLAIEGTAHLVSLSDAAANITARRTDGQGEYRVRLRSDASRVDATLFLEEPAGGTLGSLLQLPGLGALSLEAILSGPRNAERLEVTARAGALRALAQGRLNLAQRNADLVYRLEAPAMAPRAGLSWQRIALTGRWQGTVTAPRADAQLRIDRLHAPGGGAVAMLSAALTADAGDLAVHAVADGLVLPGPRPRLLADAPLHLDADMRLSDASRPLHLTAEHPLASLQVRAVTRGAMSATFALRVPDLAPLAAAIGQKIHGRTELKGTLQQSSGTTHLDLDADTQVADEATLLTSLLAGPSHLQLSAALTRQNLEVERLTVTGRSLSASASGSAHRGATNAAHGLQSLQARYELSVANLAVLSSALGGTLKGTGQVSGPISSLASESRLTLSMSIRGAPRETIEASIAARGLPRLASATLEARGHLERAPLQLDASLERTAGDTFHVMVRRAEWKSARMEGDLSTGAHTRAGHGNLRLSVQRLEDLQPLLGTTLKGSLAGNLSLRPVAAGTYAQLQLNARNIVAADISANAQFTASGPLDALALQMKAQSPNLRGEPASLDTAAHLSVTARKLRLERVEAHYHGQSLHLLAPAQVDFADGVTVSALKLGLLNAVMELDGRVSPALDLHASAHHIDAALVNAFVPGSLDQGTLGVDARLSGTPAAPSGVVTLTVAGLRPAAARDLPPVEVRGTARLMGRAARVDAHLNAGHASQLTLTGTMPLEAQGAIDLKLNGKLDAGLVNPMLEARGARMAGDVTINATVKGAAASPEVGGTVDLANGDLRDYAQGAHLSNITAHLTGNQGSLRIETLTARAGPGELALTGQIGILQPQQPLSLRLTAKNAQPITSDVLTASLDADLRAEGTLRQRINLSGTVNLKHAVIGIPNALPPEVAVLDVRRPGQAPPPPPERTLVIGLDLKLHAPRAIFVQGRGLNAELGGDLHIGGTTAHPVVSGGFEMIRGTFALASTQLNFTSGRVSFNGAGLTGKIDPTLDFTAQTTVADGTQSTLHITGLADSPQFQLSSSPPLPQDEILARLLFGQSASQLSALQVAEIGAALAKMSGVGGSGPDPLARIQKALGLDRLSVASGSSTGAQGPQNTGTSVEAGRYVSNRVFVGAKQSTTGFSQVEVDVDLSKHLKLQTRLGNGTATTQGTTPENDPGSSIGMVYQFQY